MKAVSLDEFLEQVPSSPHSSHEICVIGICGKTTRRQSEKFSLVNELTDRQAFPVYSGLAKRSSKARSDSGQPPLEPPIAAYYNAEDRVLFLVLSSAADHEYLQDVCKELGELERTSHAAAHAFWRAKRRSHCLGLLFLFSLCHLVLLTHPTCTLDVSYDHLFRAVDLLRQKAQPLLRTQMEKTPVGSEWQLHCRPCPPRLLFIFGPVELGALTRGHENLDVNDKPRRNSPRRRLQHALEDQIYRIFRKSRLLTNQSINCLFTVPANQAFVYILTKQSQDPTSTLVAQLQKNCTIKDSESSTTGPCRFRLSRASGQPGLVPPAPAPQLSCSFDAMAATSEASLHDFVWQHAHLVLTRRGFEDSVGRNPQPSHLEVPTLLAWATVATRLRVAILSDYHNQVDETFATAAKGHTGSADDDEDNCEELAQKMKDLAQCLEGFLDVDAKFSDSRCQKALPLAHAAYQANLPHHYTSSVHRSQLAHAARVYRQQARGPASQFYLNKLHEDCMAFWTAGHQLCEERSLTDQHCMHKYHIVPQPGELPDPDCIPLVLPHCSRARTTGTCNCGYRQATRDDPFTLQAANFDFYEMLEEKCCKNLEHFAFPVFQHSGDTGTPPATSLVGRPHNLDSVVSERVQGPPTQDGAAALSLVFSLGQATGSPMVSLENIHGTGGDLSEAQGCGGQSEVFDGAAVVTDQSQVTEQRPSKIEGGGEVENENVSHDGAASKMRPLQGMLHLGCRPGVLPTFSSWSLIRLGPAKTYISTTGLVEQPGFLQGSHYLMPWDVPLPGARRVDDASLTEADSWPVVQVNGTERLDGDNWRGFSNRQWRRGESSRAYVGFEYEDPRGRRFMSSAPDKVMKVASGSGYREFAGRALASDMPLYIVAPTQGRGSKPVHAQLMRMFVVVPDAPVHLLLSPQVQAGPPPCPTFVPEQPEVELPRDGVWVLRFPYSYGSNGTVWPPPRESQAFSSFKLLRGVLRVNSR
uniref:Nonsense-mediated mRNA decay factor SMG8 n=1 Tax=Eptatretus burgeri TaxID=7764 RepID=A0A8C4R9L3_EPTBU